MIETLENSIQLGNVQQFLDPQSRLQELHIATPVPRHGIEQTQLAQARIVHIRHICQVNDEKPFTAIDQLLGNLPQSGVKDGQASSQFDDDDVLDFGNLNGETAHNPSRAQAVGNMLAKA
jgi:hypothetical protein